IARWWESPRRTSRAAAEGRTASPSSCRQGLADVELSGEQAEAATEGSDPDRRPRVRVATRDRGARHGCRREPRLLQRARGATRRTHVRGVGRASGGRLGDAVQAGGARRLALAGGSDAEPDRAARSTPGASRLRVHGPRRGPARPLRDRVPAALHRHGAHRRGLDLLGAGKRGRRVRAIVRGCRGSLATPGSHTLRRGGNTSCVEIRLPDETLLILDAGTGIRELGVELAGRPGRRPIHLVLTHLHLDHLEGLGFFVPLWQPETELHIWGPPSKRESLRSRIARFLAPPFFPVLLADAPSHITFHDVPHEPWTIGKATITAQPVLHPGPTVGYRVEAEGGVLVYLPDHEPYLGGQRPDIGTDWISGFDPARDADL